MRQPTKPETDATYNGTVRVPAHLRHSLVSFSSVFPYSPLAPAITQAYT
jgi:hypothetical protein